MIANVFGLCVRWRLKPQILNLKTKLNMSNKDLFGNETTNGTKPVLGAVSFKMICANCMDFDAENNTCTIRYLIHKDKTKSPMPRKANQKGCQVFMQK